MYVKQLACQKIIARVRLLIFKVLDKQVNIPVYTLTDLTNLFACQIYLSINMKILETQC